MAIARFEVVALDCADPDELAAFYGAILGLEAHRPYEAAPQWVELKSPSKPTIAFQKIDGYEPPTWPGGDRPQQAHMDFEVDDLDVGEAEVLELGARKADVQPSPENFRVFFDPAGHPFCLVR